MRRIPAGICNLLLRLFKISEKEYPAEKGFGMSNHSLFTLKMELLPLSAGYGFFMHLIEKVFPFP